ncbi:MFS transporter [Hominifimenecus sp. rT4P-3]|uniref:MFS transporter n=1 Tax=Hominifimenecus sp. rT4P-3 TaxID=3242979 RepID=UPI003DA1EB15
MSEEKEALWTRDFLTVCLVATLLRICMQFKSSILPLYVVELGFSKSAAGLTTTAYTMAALFFRPVVGNAIDRLGRKRMLIMGASLVCVTMFPFAFLRALPLMYLLQIVSGIGFSIQSVALSTMTTDLVPEKRLTEGLGYYGLTSTISQAIGPAIALWMAGSFGYNVDFLTAGGICILALAAATLIRYEKKRFQKLKAAPETRKAKEVPRKWWHKIIEPTALVPGLLMMGISFASASVMTFLAAYGQEKGIEGIGAFFTAQAVGLAISRVFAGKIVDVIGKRKSLVSGIACMAAAFLGIHVAKSLAVMLVVAIVYAIGFGLATVVLNTIAVLQTPSHRRGAANATFYLAQDGGIGLGAALFGYIADGIGLLNIYLCAAGICLAVLFFVFPAVRRMGET